MADTVTPRLGMTKPEIGASNNTWGTKVNANFDILDAKVVYNTTQWSMGMGDGNPSAGPFYVTRYGNDGLRINEVMIASRQTGVVNFPSGVGLGYAGAFPTPPAGQISFYADGYGNVLCIKPDGSVSFLGVPPGTIVWTAAGSADAGYVLCQGGTVPRASNPYLWARIGNNFGGDANNIGIPDIRGRTIANPDSGAGRLVNAFAGNYTAAGGFDYHYLTANQTPTHTHSWGGAFGSRDMGSWQHSHGVNGGVKGGRISFQRPRDFAADASIPYDADNIGINNAELNHTHITDVGGTTGTGDGLGSNWHPNVQPTICLYAQMRLG